MTAALDLPIGSDLDDVADPAARLLSLVEPASKLLVEAVDVKHVGELRAQSEALATYAQVRRLSDEAVGAAQTIARRAELRLGQLLPRQKTGPREFVADVQQTPLSASERSRLRRLAENADVVETAIAELAPRGELSQGAVLSRIKRLDRQRADRAARVVKVGSRTTVTGPGWTMIRGPMQEVCAELAPGSVDMIITDPPYTTDSLPLWSALGEHAARLLTAGGVLDAMSGTITIDRKLECLAEHLQFGWLYVQPLPGAQSRILGRHVCQTFKPWLSFSNGPWPSGRILMHGDTLDGHPPARDRWTWEQTVGPGVQLVEIHCPTDGIVLDPFAGTGTYGEATLDAGREFVGVEADIDRFDMAVARLRRASERDDAEPRDGSAPVTTLDPRKVGGGLRPD